MGQKWRDISTSRWIVLGAAIWIQACDGVGYAFGSYSPVIKKALGYSQQQISGLGVAKDIGDSVGLLAGTLCDLLPIWGLFLVGAFMNLIGYGFLWLVVTGQAPAAPFWAMCILICLATNGETFLNTGVLIACVRNFPHNRGGIVGILKGFTGLSGAIFTQVYTSFYAPEKSKFIFLVAVGPFIITIFGLFIVRPIHGGGSGDAKEDKKNFRFIYSVCLVIAAYLMGAMVLQDFIDVSSIVQLCIAFGLLILFFLPLGFPLHGILSSPREVVKGDEESAPLLPSEEAPKVLTKTASGRDISVNGVEKGGDSPPGGMDFADYTEMEDERIKPAVSERARKARLKAMRELLFKAVAEGAVKVKRRKGPRRGEDFTLRQALVKADFWLLFASLVCGAGSGLTVIDNLGQIGESLGYASAHFFVSLISVWSFLGRIGSGWASEIIAREYGAPRPILLAIAQSLMAVGLFYLAMSWPGCMYLGSLLVGFGYGCHWAVIPATASELFGLKNFGALYNVLTVAVPTGSLIFSGLVAGPLYDREAARQQDGTVGFSRSFLASSVSSTSDEAATCVGKRCFELAFFLMTTVCIVGAILNGVLVKRTYRVYQALYGKVSKPRPSIPALLAIEPAVDDSDLRPVMEEWEEEASSSQTT